MGARGMSLSSRTSRFCHRQACRGRCSRRSPPTSKIVPTVKRRCRPLIDLPTLCFPSCGGWTGRATPETQPIPEELIAAVRSNRARCGAAAWFAADEWAITDWESSSWSSGWEPARTATCSGA